VVWLVGQRRPHVVRSLEIDISATRLVEKGSQGGPKCLVVEAICRVGVGCSHDRGQGRSGDEGWRDRPGRLGSLWCDSMRLGITVLLLPLSIVS